MLTLALLLSTLAVQDADRARAAVERSLPFLEREGLAWMEKRGCLSCHQVPFMLWAHDEARAKGVAVDAAKRANWTEWSTKESEACRTRTWLTGPILDSLKSEGMPAETVAKLMPFTTKPELKGGMKEAAFRNELAKALTAEERSRHEPTVLRLAAHGKGDGGGVDTMAQLLMAGVGSPEFAASTRAHIAGFQQPDGSWKPNGQLFSMNRSRDEAIAITTMWTAIALGAGSEAAVKGVAFVRKGAKGKTTEWLVARAILESTFGDRGASEEFVRELRSRQNPDGGWSAVPEAAGDAFATGLALYALGSAEDAAVPRARKFLVESQSEDGSWAIPLAPWSKSGSRPEPNPRLELIYRYWGSAWAAIGLAR